MDNEPQMENEPQAAKTGTPSRMKTAGLVVGVIAVGAVMALMGQNSKQCDCGYTGPKKLDHDFESNPW
jgi:hypothetical protein